MNRVFYIAGVQFRPAGEIRKAAELMKVGDHLGIVPEPTNKYDPNAVKIEYNTETADGIVSTFLGYVPKKFSSEVSAMLGAGIELKCIVEMINPQAKPWELCRVRIKSLDEPDFVDEGGSVS
jgi:hypothetical protein